MHLVRLASFLLLPIPWIQAQELPKIWRVSERPTLSIGSRDGQGPEVFGLIVGAVRLSSGSVLVADGMGLELRLFSPTGKLLGISGGKGGGPGEFRSIKALHRCAGDSVFVYDPALFRISVFNPDGVFVRTVDLRKSSPNGFPPYDFWCHPSGVLTFIHRSTDPPNGEGPLRPNVEISLVGVNNSAISLGTFPASERYFQGRSVGPRHLGKETTVAVGSHSVYVGTGDAFEVAVFSLHGERVGTLREARRPIPVTTAQVNAYIKESIAGAVRANTAGYEQFFRGLEWPKVYPAYRKLMVDGSDNLWIEEYPIPGRDNRDWTIYDQSGLKLAMITLPRNFRLVEIGRDYVLGVWRDELDVDYLRVYTLIK
jgi:hypothetical protein